MSPKNGKLALWYLALKSDSKPKNMLPETVPICKTWKQNSESHWLPRLLVQLVQFYLITYDKKKTIKHWNVLHRLNFASWEWWSFSKSILTHSQFPFDIRIWRARLNYPKCRTVMGRLESISSVSSQIHNGVRYLGVSAFRESLLHPPLPFRWA